MYAGHYLDQCALAGPVFSCQDVNFPREQSERDITQDGHSSKGFPYPLYFQ